MRQHAERNFITGVERWFRGKRYYWVYGTNKFKCNALDLGQLGEGIEG